MPPRNVPASVRTRLRNRARSDQRSFDELLAYFANERFLYRLSQSEYAEHFILKGALMLQVWQSPDPRPTKDIDLLGRTGNEEPDIVALMRDILSVEVQPDGLIPINHDWITCVSAGKPVKAFRSQRQPHSCLTRSGSACQAFRIGSRTACLAFRVG